MKSNCKEATKFLLIFVSTFFLITILWQYGGELVKELSSILINRSNQNITNNTLLNSFSKKFINYSPNITNNYSINEFNKTKFFFLSKASNDILLRLPSQNGCGNPDFLFRLTHKKPFLNRFSRIVRGHETTPNSYPW